MNIFLQDNSISSFIFPKRSTSSVWKKSVHEGHNAGTRTRYPAGVGQTKPVQTGSQPCNGQTNPGLPLARSLSSTLEADLRCRVQQNGPAVELSSDRYKRRPSGSSLFRRPHIAEAKSKVPDWGMKLTLI